MSTKTNNHIIWSNYNLDLKVTSKDITKYTCSIGKHVRNVYGW